MKDTIEITNSKRLVYPELKLTKEKVVNYYDSIYPLMSRHVSSRQVVVKRFNNNIYEEGFFQRNASDYFPIYLKGKMSHIVCNSSESIRYLSNKNSVEYYIGLSNVNEQTHPNKLIIDLDPPGDDSSSLVPAAKALKSMLDELKLDSYLMTTGSKGLHIVIPVAKRCSWLIGREFIKLLCGILVKNNPEKYTLSSRLSDRKSKLYLDYTRNALGQVTIAPYSLRAKTSGSVALPISWSKLKGNINGGTFSYKDALKSLKLIDPWKSYYLSNNDIMSAKDHVGNLVDRTYSSSPKIITKSKNGKDFDLGFYPSYTPVEMIKMGVFGGAYFCDPKLNVGTPSEIKSQDKNLWGRTEPDKGVNYYGVLAGSDLKFWTDRNLIHPDDPAGWFHWYMKYYNGRRHADDSRQIKRWRSFVARHGAQAYGKPGRERQKQALLQWAWNNDHNPKVVLHREDKSYSTEIKPRSSNSIKNLIYHKTFEAVRRKQQLRRDRADFVRPRLIEVNRLISEKSKLWKETKDTRLANELKGLHLERDRLNKFKSIHK